MEVHGRAAIRQGTGRSAGTARRLNAPALVNGPGGPILWVLPRRKEKADENRSTLMPHTGSDKASHLDYAPAW
jgi:hypothetical protein